MTTRTLIGMLLGVAALVAVACGGGPNAVADGQRSAAGDAPVKAAAAKSGLSLVSIGSFTEPVYVTGAPGDTRRVFVVERTGRIRVVRGGRKLSRPFLDITAKVTSGGSEQGLLSVAFAPDYAKTKRFYVYYTDKDGKQNVVEYKRSTADVAAASSARAVLRMDDPEENHNGGQLQFGPDRLLYIGTGDGGGANDQHGSRGNAQNLGSPLGKLLRIDPRRSGSKAYTVPASNPFATRDGARAEIYSYGLRNPWRFSFDRSTGDLVIGDVGQNAVEEVDFMRKGSGLGANFGWRPLEGTRVNFSGESAPNAVPPVIQKSHDDGWCSITGGYVVRDPKLSLLKGRYVYGDFCQGRVRAARLSTSGSTGDKDLGLPKIDSLSSFGQDTAGRIYVASLSGKVYRLAQK